MAWSGGGRGWSSLPYFGSGGDYLFLSGNRASSILIIVRDTHYSYNEKCLIRWQWEDEKTALRTGKAEGRRSTNLWAWDRCGATQWGSRCGGTGPGRAPWRRVAGPPTPAWWCTVSGTPLTNKNKRRRKRRRREMVWINCIIGVTKYLTHHIYTCINS